MTMIERAIEDWHKHLKGELPGGLDSLLADDVVFYSPIVFTPQRGKELTKLYLNAASQSLGGESQDRMRPLQTKGEGKFRYIKQVLAGATMPCWSLKPARGAST